MYRIIRIIGNNFVIAISEKGENVILQGLGIGFNQRKGFIVKNSQIERIYRMENDVEINKLTELINHIPHEHVSFVATLIDEIQLSFENKLRPNIYISLTDHISFAVERFNTNQTYGNAILNEIKTFYPKEFNIGVQTVDKINKHFKINLPIDEAGFIALHIVNAELSINMSDTVQMTKIINEIIKTIKDFYPNQFNKDSFNTSRLITHVKYLAQGIFNNKLNSTKKTDFDIFLKKKYPVESECVLKIREKLEEEYKKPIDDEELLMLAIQIHKINS